MADPWQSMADATPSPAKPITVDGEPGWSLPGAMPAGTGPTVKVLCVSPAGQSRSIERRRIATRQPLTPTTPRQPDNHHHHLTP